MKNLIRQNLTLVLAFTLPLLLIFFITITTYVPSLLLSTQYDFIYVVCDKNLDDYYYNCEEYLAERYSVLNGYLVQNELDIMADRNADGEPDYISDFSNRIFLHDTETNVSREITLAEVSLLPLSELLTSPDDVTVSSHYSGGMNGFFPFDGGSSSFGYYLTKGSRQSRLDLINAPNQYYYQYNFRFIGWILPNNN